MVFGCSFVMISPNHQQRGLWLWDLVFEVSLFDVVVIKKFKVRQHFPFLCILGESRFIFILSRFLFSCFPFLLDPFFYFCREFLPQVSSLAVGTVQGILVIHRGLCRTVFVFRLSIDKLIVVDQGGVFPPPE